MTEGFMERFELYRTLADSLDDTKALLLEPAMQCPELLLQLAANAFTAYAYAVQITHGEGQKLSPDLWETANKLKPILLKIQEEGHADFDHALIQQDECDKPTHIFD